MPVDPMIARPYVAQFGDTLREAMRTKVADDYRNALMQQRNNELAFEREQAAATAAQEDEEERLWDEAYARKDWGALARIDPQTTRVLMEHEKAQQAPAPVARPEVVEQDGYSYLFGDKGVVPGSVQIPQRAGGGPASLVEPTTDQRNYEWFAGLSPEDKAAFLNMKRANATPEAAAATVEAREAAKARTAAAGDLPRIEANATELLGTLDALEQAPGFNRLWGAYSLAPVIPGTEQADAFAIWEQIQGKAFLEAFNTLKGGGQITEKEGEKATEAITRLAQRKQSIAGAQAAIRDLRGVVGAAVARAQSKARRDQAPEGASAPAVRRFNPETGRIE